MFTHFFYFIIALLIYATYQPTEELELPLAKALLLGLLLTGAFIAANKVIFRRFKSGLAKTADSQVDHRFQSLLTRQCIIAIVVFAIDIYGLNFPSYFHQRPIFQTLPTLLALVFMAFFILHLVIVWYFAYPIYRPLVKSDYSRREYVISQLLMALPVMLPWLMLSGCLDAIRLLPLPYFQQLLAMPEGEIIYFFVFLTTVAILGPFWLQKNLALPSDGTWFQPIPNCQRLPPSRRALQ